MGLDTSKDTRVSFGTSEFKGEAAGLGKKIRDALLTGAVLVAGAAGLTGCASSNEGREPPTPMTPEERADQKQANKDAQLRNRQDDIERAEHNRKIAQIRRGAQEAGNAVKGPIGAVIKGGGELSAAAERLFNGGN